MALRRAPLEYNRTWQMRLWLLGVFFFLYAPLVALIAFSFNDSKRNTVWRGFTGILCRKSATVLDFLPRKSGMRELQCGQACIQAALAHQ